VKALRLFWKAIRALAIFFFLLVGGFLFDLCLWALLLSQVEDGVILGAVASVCFVVTYALMIYG